MDFRTEIKIDKSQLDLSIDSPVAMLGSCFVENIGARMRKCLWNACLPWGVLFNPLSIATTVRSLFRENDWSRICENSIFESDGLFHTWLGDSSFTSDSKTAVLTKLMEAQKELKDTISKGRVLFITFGTSYCYFLASDPGFAVANCHKQPSVMFIRRKISINQIVKEWTDVLEKLRLLYPDIKVVFTVSPVRHLRDGLIDNSRSKAVLILGVEQLCEKFDFCKYFPAFEIINDDLRDYRFYAEDMVHPSDVAVEYVWECFKQAFISEQNQKVLEQGDKLWRRLNHRPIIANSPQAAAFKSETMRLATDFLYNHPLCTLKNNLHCTLQDKE